MKSRLILSVISIILFYSFQANAFKFDMWESGMDKDQILITAERNNIKISGGETLYSYTTTILDKRANVSLELTRGDYKLMKLSIRWANDFNNFDNFYKVLAKIIEGKNPISIKKGIAPILMLMENSCLYMLDKDNSVEIKDTIMHSSVEMIYTDIPLEIIDKKRKEWDKKEDQRKAVMKDIDKFNPDNKSSQELQQEEGKIYRWTDDNGIAHFSNMEEGKSASIVKMKPIGKVQLKEILWYNVCFKNGSKIKAKKIKRLSENKLTVVEGVITTEIPINEISKIEETSKVGGKIQVELRSPDSF